MLSQIRYLKADLCRRDYSSLKSVFYELFDAGMWVVIFYRASRCFFLAKIPLVKHFLRLAGFFIFKLSEAFFGVSLPPSVDIGPGLYIGHTGLLIFHHQVKIGSNFSVTHGVTIGAGGVGKIGVPEIGNNVYVGSGAKILGKIKVGDNVRIGANAVVVRDLPASCTAVGVPARPIFP